MAYKDGTWESDREVRRKNEHEWNKVGVNPKDHTGKAKTHTGGHTGGPVGRPMSDLDRAIQGAQATIEQAKRDRDGHAVKPGGGARVGNLNISGGIGASKIDRPIIPGGCTHNGTKVSLVLSNGKRIYGARGSDIKDPGHLDLIIDCAGLVQGKKFLKSSTAPRYRKLNAVAFPDVINLAWPDMTAPTEVGLRFWQQLLALLPDDTCIACMGSHGRTGTAMAALLVADGMDGDAAIARVRKEHCLRAIETTGQENYIRRLAQSRKDAERGGK